MTAKSLRADTIDLILHGGAPIRRHAAALIISIAVVTAVLYALPLAQEIDNAISNGVFVMLSAIVIVIAVFRARSSRGAHRAAFVMLSTSFTVTVALFMLDPQQPEGDLTVALDLAVVVSLGFWVSVLALSVPALPGLASLRAAADALWVTTALLIAVWPWTIDPLLRADGPTPIEDVLHIAFAISTITMSTTVLVIVPHTAGRGRVALWGLGAGGAVASAAGVFHIRFFYEGTLRFGSWWDYLWTLGLAMLALAGLVTVENEIVPRRRGVRWHSAMTVLPLALATPALLATEPGAPRLVGALILLGLLALRVIALLAENERLARSLAADARIDPLTGLGNRRALADGIDGIGVDATTAAGFRALAVIDLDHFKEVNDTHGHLVGDEVLRIVARRLREAVRDTDLLIRHGGDEFIAAMTVRNELEAVRAAGRLGDAVRGDVSTPVGTLTIGATIGVAMDRGKGRLVDIMAVADAALYEAKAAGRGSVHLEICDAGEASAHVT